MIGIFDSGSGGLTVMRAIRDVLPSSDVIYFGDIGNAPYGNKTQGELMELTVSAIQRLRKAGATSIVSACNSVSASLAVSLSDALDNIPLIEMVGPTAQYFSGFKGKLLVCATPATIESRIYEYAFRMRGLEIETLAISDLAYAIEIGDEVRAEEAIRKAFSHIVPPHDAILLCCTHYPLAVDLFKKILGDVPLIDPSIAVAARVEDSWFPREVGNSNTRFLISKDSLTFRELVQKLFPDVEYSIEVVSK